MKKYVLFGLMLFFTANAFSQVKDPVSWTYKAIKKSDKVYDIVISAALKSPWHIYSMNTPDGGPLATKFVFQTNPLLTFEGKMKEVGKLKKERDNIFNVDVLYYANEVKYIQTVKLKSSVKTNLNTTVEYMVCDDEQCLPPTKKSFNIQLL